MQKRKACGVLLVRGRPIRQFLLMRHPRRWDLPKGHLEPGETETECALREMYEETGIDPSQVQLDPHFRFTTVYPVRYKKHGDKVFEKTLVVFLGYLAGQPEIEVSEHHDYRWWDWNPPHHIQRRTIDPLLHELEAYFTSADKAVKKP